MTSKHWGNLKINDSVRKCKKYFVKGKRKTYKEIIYFFIPYLVLIAKRTVSRWNGKEILLTCTIGQNKSVNTKSKFNYEGLLILNEKQHNNIVIEHHEEYRTCLGWLLHRPRL